MHPIDIDFAQATTIIDETKRSCMETHSLVQYTWRELLTEITWIAASSAL